MNDLRFAVRQLLKHPAFALIAIVTLALGIGATTTIFSVLDHLVLKDLPFPEPDRIVTLLQRNPRSGLAEEEAAPGNYLAWKERSRVFAAMGATEPFSYDLTGEGRPEVMLTSLVTEGFFDALGVEPLAGRLFRPEDFQPGAPGVAVLGYDLWQRRFGGDPTLVNRTLVLDGNPFTVVGILPRDFDVGLGYASIGRRDFFAPRQLQGWEVTSRTTGWWTVMGRLAPGVTLEQAQAEMDRVAATLSTEFPATNEGVGVSVVPLRQHLVGAVAPTLYLLLGAVGFVLLVACVNVANLQLARGAERGREFAIRAAVGGARGRLIRQLVLESVLLGVVGTAAGVALAFWAVDLVKALAPGDIARFSTVAVNLRVLGFAVVLAGASAVLFGLAPALQLSRPDLRDVLSEGRGSAGRGRMRLREGLIVLETALALTLLVGASLLLRSFGALLAQDPGFKPDHLLALQVFYYEDGHKPADRVAFFERTVEKIEALPGVQSAGAVSAAPFAAADLAMRRALHVVGDAVPRAGEEPQGYWVAATPGYFGTMHIPLLEGRMFAPSDRGDGTPVALINETLRRRLFAERDPIGAQMVIGNGTTPVEIIGVVGDVRHTGLDADPRPEVFVPEAQAGSGSMTYFVRTTRAPADLLPQVQETVWAEAPLLTFYQTGTAEELVSSSLVARRFSLVLLSVFAGIALLMATVGIYGVINFTVKRRTGEIGIRMALGADRASVVRMIVRRGLVLAGGGVLIGLLLSLLATPLMRKLLFEVSPRDGLAFVIGILVLVAASALASWLPARRATRISPMEALRYE